MITVKRFTASWCAPCRQLAPIMESVSKKMPNVHFVTVDIDGNQDQAVKYQVRSVPTVIIENNGKIVNRFVGVQQESAIVQLINESKS